MLKILFAVGISDIERNTFPYDRGFAFCAIRKGKYFLSLPFVRRRPLTQSGGRFVVLTKTKIAGDSGSIRAGKNGPNKNSWTGEPIF